MEFKFRAVDKRRPNDIPPYFSSSSSDYMSGQAFRPVPNSFRSWHDPVQRQLEKAQIRKEIIASEIARRRALEAEVRSELTAERALVALYGGSQAASSFEQRLTMQLQRGLPSSNGFESHLRWQREERFELLPAPPLPPSTTSPSPPMLTPLPVDAEGKATSEGNENKLIVLAKPDPNRAVGAKRKTPLPTSIGELPLHLFSLKKPNQEWSCAICQVSATSERGLTEHLQGKKHLAKKAKLTAERMEKNCNSSTTTLPKEPRKHAEVAKMAVSRGLGSETETDEKLPALNENGDDSDQKLEDAENLKNKKDELLIQKKHKKKKAEKNGKSLVNKHGLAKVEMEEKTPEDRINKKFKFWCPICLVGTHSEAVMEDHNKGKRHIAQLRALGKTNAATPAGPATTTTDIQLQKLDKMNAAAPSNTSAESQLQPIDNINAAAATTEQAPSDSTQMPKDSVLSSEADKKLMDVPRQLIVTNLLL